MFKFIIGYLGRALLVVALAAFGLPILLMIWLVGSAICLFLAAVLTILPRRKTTLWPLLCQWEEDE